MNATDKLKGMTLLIGKKPVEGCLLVAFTLKGQLKTLSLGAPNSVPGSVSRCKAAEGVAHCKLAIDQNGKMVITNLKQENVTYVNGMEVQSKKVGPDSTVELGMDRYAINIGTIVENVAKAIDKVMPPPPKEYSISHLEAVWTDYDTRRTNEQLSEQKKNNLQRLGGILSSCGILFMFFEGMGNLRFVFTGVSVVIALVFFFRGLNTSNSLLMRLKKIDEDFQQKYVCPNPDCRHYLGNKPYHLLRQDKSCPWCKCRYVEK